MTDSFDKPLIDVLRKMNKERAEQKKKQIEIGRSRLSGQSTVVGDTTTIDEGYDEKALLMHGLIMSNLKTALAQHNSDSLRNLWPLLVSARVFAVPVMAYLSTRVWADRFTTEHVAKLDDTDDPNDEHASAYVERMIEAAEQQPFPERLPFPSTLLVYGAGAPLSEGDLAGIKGNMNGPSAFDTCEQYRLLAQLVSDKGEAWDLLLALDEDQTTGGVIVREQRSPQQGWLQTHNLTLVPWILPSMIDLINSYKTIVKEQERTMRFKRDWQARQKKWKSKGMLAHPIPPMFYRVPLRQEHVEERLHARGKQLRAEYRRWKLAHRCDVRGHERVRYCRGKLPMHPDVEKDYRERGYRIFTQNALDADTAKLLLARNVRGKAHDEWLVVKATWVKPHQRGPEDAPYVPALRVVPQPGQGTP